MQHKQIDSSPAGNPTSTQSQSAGRWRRQARKLAVQWHQTIAIFGGVALLLWALSGLTHIVMATFGPQQAVFFPPQRPLQLTGTSALRDILANAGIDSAQAVRVVVSEQENLLQVTTRQDQPRRYFRLSDGLELSDHDQRQAVFLARHYLGNQLQDAAVRQIEYVTAFSDAYPSVNRLLPVYRIEFDRDDHLTAYIYTETGAVAAISNDFKHNLQQVFQWVHTWSWFPREAEWGRLLLIVLLVGSLLALALTGVGMLLLIRRRRRAPGQRGWHRLAGYVLALPLLMFTSSGLWHLLQYSGLAEQSQLKMSPPLALQGVDFPLHTQWTAMTEGLNVNHLSIVHDGDRFLYRLGLARPRGGAPDSPTAIRNARFAGISPTGPALYLDAASGQPWPQGDRELAIRLGELFTGLNREHIDQARLITRFGSGYDFRNKRLPVWRLDYAEPLHSSVFVDTASGVQADRMDASRRPEQFSFSMLHKWNFLRPVGRNWQNIILTTLLLSSVVLMGIIGLRMDWRRRQRKRQQKQAGVASTAGPKAVSRA